MNVPLCVNTPCMDPLKGLFLRANKFQCFDRRPFLVACKPCKPCHTLVDNVLSLILWSRECVMTGVEGLMSSGSVTDVTIQDEENIFFFCWTVRA